MTIYSIKVFGFTIRFADDGPIDGKPLWKSAVDQSVWSVGQVDLGVELQSRLVEVTEAAKSA